MGSRKANAKMKWLIVLIAVFLAVCTGITMVLINYTFYVAGYDDLTSEEMRSEIECIEKSLMNARNINSGTMNFESEINSVFCEATVVFDNSASDGICRKVTAEVQDESKTLNEPDKSGNYAFEVQLQPRKYYLLRDGKRAELDETSVDWDGITYIDRQVLDIGISDAFWHGIGGIAADTHDIKKIEKYRQGRNTIYKIAFTQDTMGYELITINHNDVVTAVEYHWVYQENNCYRKVTVISSAE